MSKIINFKLRLVDASNKVENLHPKLCRALCKIDMSNYKDVSNLAPIIKQPITVKNDPNLTLTQMIFSVT